MFFFITILIFDIGLYYVSVLNTFIQCSRFYTQFQSPLLLHLIFKNICIFWKNFMIKYFKINFRIKQFLIYQQIQPTLDTHRTMIQVFVYTCQSRPRCITLVLCRKSRLRGRGIESQPQTWTCFKYIASIQTFLAGRLSSLISYKPVQI